MNALVRRSVAVPVGDNHSLRVEETLLTNLGAVSLWLLVLLCLALPSGYALADDDDDDASQPINTGQDPTRPVARLDIRFQDAQPAFDLYHNNFDEINSASTLVFRADAPMALGEDAEYGSLAFRFDLPIASTSSSTPGQDGRVDLGSFYGQMMHNVPESWFLGDMPWAWGIATYFANATNGRREYTWGGLLGFSKPFYPFGKDVGGTAFIPTFKYFYAPEETQRNGTLFFDEIGEFRFQPIINFTLPWDSFQMLSFWANYEWLVTTVDGGRANPAQKSGDYFIPYDVTIGKMLAKNTTVLSLTLSGPLLYSENYRQYDHRAMIRIGFFFGQ